MPKTSWRVGSTQMKISRCLSVGLAAIILVAAYVGFCDWRMGRSGMCPICFPTYAYVALLGTRTNGTLLPTAQLAATFTVQHNTMSGIIAACHKMPDLRTIDANSEMIFTYRGVDGGDIPTDRIDVFRQAMADLGAVQIYCGWRFGESEPRLVDVDIRTYAKIGPYLQHIQSYHYWTEWARAKGYGQSRVEDVAVTPLPEMGWYIWEQGINHKDAAP